MSGIVYCEGRFVSEGEARIGLLDCGLTPASRLLPHQGSPIALEAA